MTGTTLPRTGLAYAVYPQRPAMAPEPRWWRALASLRACWPRVPQAALPAALEAAYREVEARLAAADRAEPVAAQAAVHANGQAIAGGTARGTARLTARVDAQQAARRALRREGFSPGAVGMALAVAADAAARACGLRAHRAQLIAAWLLVDGRFAEMATGEGKTLAMGLAAAVAAQAGVPVHVLTANDYLAQRDRDLMAPMYDALGLSSAAVVGATPAADRPAQYGCCIVHSTAREVGFDYLREHLRQGGERDPRRLRARTLAGQPSAPALLPGLCFALLDEADGLLLDEAGVPLLVAQPGEPLDDAELRQAWALSADLREGEHFTLERPLRRASLTAAGRDAVAAAAPARARWTGEMVEAALAARWLYRRDREYLVGPRGVALIDESTGRVAEGRRWSGLLHPMVQVKEGEPPTAPARTAAQITYPRLFARYLRLAGMSGTLQESRWQLRAMYGVDVLRVPRTHPSRRRWLGLRVYADAGARWNAVVDAVRRHTAAGRPVLVGTDSVAATEALSRHLADAGIEHQCLDARQDADEAQRVARAGEAGRVTVATNIAGRGTDIRLDAAAHAAGGLHVIAAVANRSRRIDRQLIGRSGRQNDPGSAEALLSLDDPLIARGWGRVVCALAARAARGGRLAPWLATPLVALAQRRAELEDAWQRWQLAGAEAQRDEALGFAGAPE